jgi:hypothetical protein
MPRATPSLTIALIFFWALPSCDPNPRVVIATDQGREVGIRVEVADTPGKRELGLQYRTEMEDDRGMLFVFPTEAIQSFWMKNTPLSLDLIFIGEDRRIVGIVREAEPFSTSSRSVARPSRFVLEIKGGLAKRLGIAVGAPVRFEGIGSLQARE